LHCYYASGSGQRQEKGASGQGGEAPEGMLLCQVYGVVIDEHAHPFVTMNVMSTFIDFSQEHIHAFTFEYKSIIRE
jgi:hypothetical protein